MEDVKDEQAVIVCIVGLDANGVAPSDGVEVTGINFDEGGFIRRIREIGPDCVCSLEVSNTINLLSGSETKRERRIYTTKPPVGSASDQYQKLSKKFSPSYVSFNE